MASRPVRLVPLRRADLARLVDDPEEFAASQGLQLGPVRDATVVVAEQSARFYDDANVDAPWAGYLAVDEGDGQVLGVCSFKGAPGPGRVVEIAYATFPPYEGQGLATAMAARLVETAWRSDEVELVLAHTLREDNASVRLLRRLGFHLVGEVIDDPADGPVWRWELRQHEGTSTTV